MPAYPGPVFAFVVAMKFSSVDGYSLSAIWRNAFASRAIVRLESVVPSPIATIAGITPILVRVSRAIVAARVVRIARIVAVVIAITTITTIAEAKAEKRQAKS